MGWEWGLVVGMMVLYIAAIEFWKLFMHRRGGYEWFGKLGKKQDTIENEKTMEVKEMKGDVAV